MDIRLIRENADEARRLLALRRSPIDIERIVALDADRRRLSQERDDARHRLSNRLLSAGYHPVEPHPQDSDLFERSEKHRNRDGVRNIPRIDRYVSGDCKAAAIVDARRGAVAVCILVEPADKGHAKALRH